ncbi:hypothetical protein GCM10027605_38200 [Micromonospora zhanjiangensis]
MVGAWSNIDGWWASGDMGPPYPSFERPYDRGWSRARPRLVAGARRARSSVAGMDWQSYGSFLVFAVVTCNPSPAGVLVGGGGGGDCWRRSKH